MGPVLARNSRCMAGVDEGSDPTRQATAIPGSASDTIAFEDPVVVVSRARNVLRLAQVISVRIPAPLCRVLLPLLSSAAAEESSSFEGFSRVSMPGHVKRVRKVENERAFVDVLLGQAMETETATTGESSTIVPYDELPAHMRTIMQEFIDSIDASSVTELPSAGTLLYAMQHVPAHAPDDVATRNDWSRAYWPVSMKLPDKQGRKEDAPLTQDEVMRMKAHMGTVYELSRSSGNRAACVIVDPTRDLVVGKGVDTTSEHPLGHAVMNAIDDVAAWQIVTWYPELKEGIHRKFVVAEGSSADTGSNMAKKDGNGIGDGDGDHHHGTDTNTDTDVPPYLSTGYDCYTLDEPCAMCAMALVHSRLRRIIYVRATEGDRGMLGSTDERTAPRLHSCRTLNHHFVVYRMRVRDSV